MMSELDTSESSRLDRIFDNPLTIVALLNYSRIPTRPSLRGYELFLAAMEENTMATKQFADDLSEVIRMYTTQQHPGPRPPPAVYEAEMQKRVDRTLEKFAGRDIRDARGAAFAAVGNGTTAKERASAALEYHLATIQKCMAAAGADGRELATTPRDASLLELLARFKAIVERESMAEAMFCAAEQLLTTYLRCATRPAAAVEKSIEQTGGKEEPEKEKENVAAVPPAKRPREDKENSGAPVAKRSRIDEKGAVSAPTEGAAVEPSDDNSDSSEDSGDDVAAAPPIV